MPGMRFFSSILLALLLLQGATTAPCEAAGMLSFTFDDGLESVYRHAFPILQRYGEKATVGIIVSDLFKGDPDYMGIREARILQEHGWEIASHGITHERPVDIPLAYGDEVLTGWKDVDPKAGIYRTRYEFPRVSVLLEGDHELLETENYARMSQVPGSYYHDAVIQEVIIHASPGKSPRSTVIRAGSYQRELEYSARELQKLGLDVSDYITPYDYWTDVTERMSRRYYAAVAAGGMNGTNYPDTADRYYLNRYVIHSDSPVEEFVSLLERDVLGSDGWVILTMHGIGDDVGWQPWPADRLERLAAWAREHGVKVVTLREGLRILEAEKRQVVARPPHPGE